MICFYFNIKRNTTLLSEGDKQQPKSEEQFVYYTKYCRISESYRTTLRLVGNGKLTNHSISNLVLKLLSVN